MATDFLFIPGASGAENLGRTVISRRPNTQLITLPPARNHIAGLLTHLSTTASITKPIGDILLVAHGNDTGEYFLPLSRALPAPADFEAADTANMDPTNPIRLTALLLTPAGGGPMNTITIRLRGCNIGKAAPFVTKLQEAMTLAGGAVNVTAPLHFDEFQGTIGGHIEYLAHKFTLKVKQRFANRTALLTAFGAAGFTYIDTTPIPNTEWTNLVPTDIHPSSHQSFNMTVGLNPPIGTRTTNIVRREYRYDTTPFSWDWRAPNPGNQAAQLALLKQTLPQGTFRGRHLYDPGYPWPLYERHGFTSIDDFVDNLIWNITFTGGVMHFRATLHEYTVMLPITDPPGPPPAPGSPRPNPVLRFYNYFSSTAGASTFQLPENNTDLFLNL